MRLFIQKIKKLSKPRKILIGLLLGLILFNFVPVVVAQEPPPIGEMVKQTWLESMPFLGPLFGSAGGAIANFFAEIIIKQASTIALSIAYLGGQIIQLESKILAWVIDMSSFTKLPIVQAGWKIVRDFTNLFFIAILIYIAFATILRLSSYSVKKTLWKVVVIAILINFSLMLSGIIIDFSQMMFKYFIFATLQEKTGHQFGVEMANALRLSTFLAPAATLQAETEKDDLFSVFIKLLFIIAFTFILVITFGALVLILLVRNFWLWILLILAPIAWFCWIAPIPILSKYWKQWWDKFLQWAFMAPIIGFFLFLALMLYSGGDAQSPSTLSTKDTLINKDALRASSLEAEKKSPPLFGYSKGENSIFNPINVMQLGLVLGFVIGGLMAGQSLGSKAAGGALGLITKAGKGTQKWMQRQGTKGVGAVGGGALTGLAATKFGKVPFLGKGVGVLGRNLQAKAEAIKGAERATAKKRIMGRSLDQLNKDWGSLTENEKFAAVGEALKEGKIPKNMEEKAMELAEKGQISKTGLLKIDPTLRRDWQEPMKKIKSLKIQKDIDEETGKLQSNIAKDFKDKSATEISKTIASVDFGKAPLLAEAFVNTMAANKYKYNPYVVMDVVNKKPIAEKASFVESLIIAKMKIAKGENDLERLADIENTDPELVKKLNRSPGLREINATWDNIKEKIRVKEIEGERTREIFESVEGAITPEDEQTPSPPSPPPSPPPPPPPPTPPPFPPPSPLPRTAPPEWTPPSAPLPRPREPWTPPDTGPRPETFRPQRPTGEIREQTRENPPEKIL